MANADDTAATKISSDKFYIVLVGQFIVKYKNVPRHHKNGVRCEPLEKGAYK